jgi:hypothetical protein
MIFEEELPPLGEDFATPELLLGSPSPPSSPEQESVNARQPVKIAANGRNRLIFI